MIAKRVTLKGEASVGTSRGRCGLAAKLGLGSHRSMRKAPETTTRYYTVSNTDHDRMTYLAVRCDLLAMLATLKGISTTQRRVLEVSVCF
jgi:hypothetical protein